MSQLKGVLMRVSGELGGGGWLTDSHTEASEEGERRGEGIIKKKRIKLSRHDVNVFFSFLLFFFLCWAICH